MGRLCEADGGISTPSANRRRLNPWMLYLRFRRHTGSMRVRCPVVIGREVEIAAMAGLIAASGAGQGGAIFLTGEPGIGKSALLRSAVAIAQDTGVESLLGRSVPGSSAVPLRPLAEAVLSDRHATVPVEDDLAPFRPALARLTPSSAEWPISLRRRCRRCFWRGLVAVVAAGVSLGMSPGAGRLAVG